MRLIFLLAITYSCVFASFGQTYQFSQLSVADGLSQSAIYSAYQDSDGYMWFGTYDGLNRYDGTDFEIFRHVRDDTTSISNNQILSITECPDNRLWVGTSSGLNVYNSDLESFDHYRIPSTDPMANVIGVMTPLCDSLLFLGTDNGGYFLRLNDKQFDHEAHASLYRELEGKRVLGAVSSGRELWITTNRDLVIYDLPRRSVLHEKSNRIDMDTAKGILVDSDGLIWLVAPDRIVRMTREGEVVHAQEIQVDNLVRKVRMVESGNQIWFSMDGLKIIDRTDYTISHVWHVERDPSSVSSNLITALAVTDNGIVWVGTPGLGMNRYDPKAYRINQLGYDNNIRPRYTTSVFTWDDQRIFSSTNKRLEYFDHTVREFRVIETADGQLVPNTDFFLALDNYLLAARRRALYLIDPSGSAVKLPAPSHVWSAIEYEGQILMGTVGGIYQLPKTKLMSNGEPNRGLQLSDFERITDFKQGRINQLMVIDGKVWVITNLGIRMLHERQLSDVADYYDNFPPVDLKQNIRSVQVAENGTIWLATVSNGIIALNLEQQTFRQYDERHGLANGSIYGILEDEENNLWVSTNQGLSELLVREEIFLNYTDIDGLQSREFNTGSFFKSESGTMYFGGVNGLNYFDPCDITILPPPANTRIVSFLLNHEEIVAGKSPILSRSIDRTGAIRLNYNQNSFEFRFTNVNFRDARSIHYQYRLSGFDEDWVEAGNQRSASYTNMAPGHYVFEVRAVNRISGIPQEGQAALSVRISEPFWRSLPFRIMAIALVLILLLAWVFYLRYRNQVLERMVGERTSQIEEQKELLLDQNRELSRSLKELKKTQEMLLHSEKMASIGTLAAGLGHEINNPLNFIKGGLGLLNRKLEDQDKETESFLGMVEAGVRRITRLIKSLQKLGVSRLGEKKPCHINELIDNSLIVLEGHFKDRVKVHKTYEQEDLYVKGYDGELQQAIHQILANADQSIKDAGEINIAASAHDGFAQIDITDSGIGIDQKDSKRVWDPFYTTRDPGKGEGLGLPIAYSVIKDHRGSITLHSKKGEGTRVTIKLPLSKV